MKKELKGNLMLLLTAMIWGSGFVAQSEGMRYVGPLTMQAARYLLSGLVLLPVIALRDRRGHSVNRPQNAAERRHLLRCGLVCGILLAAASTLQQYGLLYTTVGKSGFITALYIILVPLIGLFLHQRAGLNIWLGVALSVAGLYFLCMTGGLGGVNLGDLLTLACSLGFALHIQYVDHIGAGVDCVRLSCIQFFVSSLLAGIGMLIFEEPSLPALLSCAVPILYAGILSGGAGYTLQILGQQYTEPTIASLLMSLESVFAVLFGWLLLHQALSTRELLGCGLMFAAIILAQLQQKRKAAA